MSRKLFHLFFILLLFTQCEDDMSEIEERQSSDDRKINEYLTENDISAEKHGSGIYYLKLKENSSGTEVEDGDIIYAKCAVSFLDGDTLETDADTIVAFEYGASSLIPEGLDIGCGLMHEGEQFKFFIPSDKAFDFYWNSDFDLDAYSILMCDFEIVNIQSKEDRLAIEEDSISSYIEREGIESLEEYASGLYFKKLTTTDEGECPDDGDIIRFHFERKYLDGTIHYSTFNNDPVTLRVGEGAVQGLEEGLKLLKPGERGLLIFPSEIGFGTSTQVIPHELRNELILDEVIANTPEPFSPLVYEVELLR